MMRTRKTEVFEETDLEQVCLNCGMLESQWKGSQGLGYWQGEKSYCCEGCAKSTGCTCADEDKRD